MYNLLKLTIPWETNTSIWSTHWKSTRNVQYVSALSSGHFTFQRLHSKRNNIIFGGEILTDVPKKGTASLCRGCSKICKTYRIVSPSIWKVIIIQMSQWKEQHVEILWSIYPLSILKETFLKEKKQKWRILDVYFSLITVILGSFKRKFSVVFTIYFVLHRLNGSGKNNIFQQEGGSSHYSNRVRNYWTNRCADDWAGSAQPVACPSCISYLAHKSFLWLHITWNIIATSIGSIKDPKTKYGLNYSKSIKKLWKLFGIVQSCNLISSRMWRVVKPRTLSTGENSMCKLFISCT